MSAKRVGLESRTSGRPIPIEIERLSASSGSQPHTFEARVAAAVGDEDRRTRRHVLDLRHEAAGADDARSMCVFERERRGDLVVPGRDVKHLILPDVGSAMRRVGRAEAVIERGLQRSGIIGRKVAHGTEAAVLHADRLEIGKQQHRSHHDQAAVVRAVHVVPPSVLI
jgi:hypothetical protein